MSIQRISDVMTQVPHGIAAEETLASAWERMKKYKVRHLPVRSRGRVVGILSERDVDLLRRLVDTEKTQVLEVMTPDPYLVPPTASLSEVAYEMMQRRIGSALVVDQEQKLLGIFTDTDALKVLSLILG